MMGYADARMMIGSQLNKYHERERPVLRYQGQLHQRSEPQEYDPTPICVLCGKAWDQTGGYQRDYACPMSPGAMLNALVFGYRKAIEQPDEEVPDE